MSAGSCSTSTARSCTADADGRAHPQPGALEVLERVRASGRRLVLFTNGSHVPSERIARGLTEDGIPIADDEMLTPVDSAISYLLRYHRDDPVLLFGSERGRRAVDRVRADGRGRRPATTPASSSSPTSTRSPMADARAGGARGQPRSAAAHRQLRARLRRRERNDLQPRRDGDRCDRQGHRCAAEDRRQAVASPSLRSAGVSACRSDEIAVIGDDLGMDIALGRLGGSRTVLVRSGISGDDRARPRAGTPAARRGHRRRGRSARRAVAGRLARRDHDLTADRYKVSSHRRFRERGKVFPP